MKTSERTEILPTIHRGSCLMLFACLHEGSFKEHPYLLVCLLEHRFAQVFGHPQWINIEFLRFPGIFEEICKILQVYPKMRSISLSPFSKCHTSIDSTNPHLSRPRSDENGDQEDQERSDDADREEDHHDREEAMRRRPAPPADGRRLSGADGSSSKKLPFVVLQEPRS